MRRRTSCARAAAGLALVGALGACSPEPTPQTAPTAAVDAANAAARADAEAEGLTVIGALGGDVERPDSASYELPGDGTLRAYAACTGGRELGLDVSGTALDLDCDGSAVVVDPLDLPDGESAVVVPTRRSDAPGKWGVAFAER